MAVEKHEPDAPPRLPVGREVRRWRQSRGLTLAQVGERSGLNVGYLSQIENEKAVPSLDALATIAAALDVPPAWLLLDSAVPPRVVRAAERPASGEGGGPDRGGRRGHLARRVHPRGGRASPATRPASTPTTATSTTSSSRGAGA